MAEKNYVATAPLFVGYARAYNPGDVVTADAVKANGWQDSVSHVGTKAAKAVDPTSVEDLAIPPASTNPPPPVPK